ncbi:MAG TPA: anthranilate/aminodeoxychorismate synthase component II, partial [Ilumatobacter sp.]|nr:anthranilate/aminodeoxychorismate synthase component II [Ilumatobacter sp.]
MARTVVVIDNYDSFTYNLVQYVAALGADCRVFLNDATTATEIQSLKPDGILLSPGPGNPDDAGVTLDVIRQLS